MTRRNDKCSVLYFLTLMRYSYDNLKYIPNIWKMWGYLSDANGLHIEHDSDIAYGYVIDKMLSYRNNIAIIFVLCYIKIRFDKVEDFENGTALGRKIHKGNR